jgi:hypothetical protein
LSTLQQELNVLQDLSEAQVLQMIVLTIKVKCPSIARLLKDAARCGTKVLIASEKSCVSKKVLGLVLQFSPSTHWLTSSTTVTWLQKISLTLIHSFEITKKIEPNFGINFLSLNKRGKISCVTGWQQTIFRT